jgi:hypothetical protein
MFENFIAGLGQMAERKKAGESAQLAGNKKALEPGRKRTRSG